MEALAWIGGVAAVALFLLIVYAGSYLEETEDEDRWL